MPAAISEFTTIDGRTIHEAMYANDPAWHRLGVVFDEDGASAPDSETAMRLAHLDWKVEKHPIFVKGLGGGPQVQVPGRVAVRRNDNGAVLGVVSPRYETYDNSEAFGFLDSLLMDGVMRYESAFALDGGARVVLLARLPSIDKIEGGSSLDLLARYVLCSACHDGTGSISFMPTSVRVVCANTLALAIQQADEKDLRLSVRHTVNMRDSLELVRKYLSIYDERFTEYAETMNTLASVGITKEQAATFIRDLIESPADDASKAARTNHERRVQAIREAWNHDTNKGIGSTWWRMLNSVTFAVDHSPAFNRYVGTDERKAENRFKSLLEGRGSALKTEALRLALDMAL